MKKIFFATPIGNVDSPEHKRSDKIVEAIDAVIQDLKPQYNLELIRVDKLLRPHSITETIRNEIAKSEFVIADLTGHNPNVYYELGYATGIQKDCIHIAEKSNSNLPFDVAQITTIFYEIDDMKTFKSSLKEMMTYVLENPNELIPVFAGPPIGKVKIDDD